MREADRDIDAMHIRALEVELMQAGGRIAELEAAARAVTWFDWSDNDEDAVRAVDALRKLVGR